MMRLRWSPAAADDLESIYDYLLHSRPAVAHATVTAIYADVKNLKRFPRLGKAIPLSDGRAYFLSPLPYVCTYQVVESIVSLLRIHHIAQDRSFLYRQ